MTSIGKASNLISILALCLIMGLPYLTLGQDGSKKSYTELLKERTWTVMMQGALGWMYEEVKRGATECTFKVFIPIPGLDGPDAVPYLISVLENGPDFDLRREFSQSVARRIAALALGTIGDLRAFEPLVAGLKDEDRGVRPYCCLGLGYLGDPRAIGPILERARLGDQISWWEALAAIGLPGAVPGMIEYGSKDPRRRNTIMRYVQYIVRLEVNITDKYMWEQWRITGSYVVDMSRFWQNWLAGEGQIYAKREFEKTYGEFLKARKEQADPFTLKVAKSRIGDKSTIVALPDIIEKIEQGDGDLVPVVVQLTSQSKRAGLKAGASRAECLNWWQANKDKWLMKFRSAEDKASEKAQSDPKDPN